MICLEVAGISAHLDYTRKPLRNYLNIGYLIYLSLDNPFVAASILSLSDVVVGQTVPLIIPSGVNKAGTMSQSNLRGEIQGV